jgi:hypothetical protein
MRSPLLLAALVSIACAAHEPAPRLRVPDVPAPAEWAGRRVPSAAPEAGATGGADEPEPPAERGVVVADAGAPEGGAVKQVESPAAEAYEEGKRAAQWAITENRLGLETFGYPARCRREYSRILWEKYKVQLLEVAGCVVDDTIVEHARGYNEVMEAEIVRRHGPDVFERASTQAGC